MNKGFGDIKADKIIEKNENSVSLIFTIPKDSLYFDGHFPDYPVLPAVAQIDIVVNFALENFGTDIIISQIKRTKFLKVITPSLSLLLKLEKKETSLNFKMTTPDSSEVYSSGSIILTAKTEN